MSVKIIGVIVVCLLVGYWIVTALLDNWTSRGAGEDVRVPTENVDWWSVLKVAPDATREEIQEAYRLQISQYHPDKVARLGDELKALAEKKSKEINAAYDRALRERAAGN